MAETRTPDRLCRERYTTTDKSPMQIANVLLSNLACKKNNKHTKRKQT